MSDKESLKKLLELIRPETISMEVQNLYKTLRNLIKNCLKNGIQNLGGRVSVEKNDF